jgi:hypothetical protein
MGNSSEVSAEEKPSEQILDGNEEPVWNWCKVTLVTLFQTTWFHALELMEDQS